MSTFSYVPFTDGQYPTATDFNQNWDSITTLVNGNLDRLNILTRYAQYAVSLRADIYNSAAHTLTVNMPARTMSPTSDRVLGLSVDFINSTATANPVTVEVYADTTLVGSASLAGSASSQENTYVSFGGTKEGSAVVPLKVKVTAGTAFANGDYLNATVFLAQELMSETEVES